MTFFQNLYLGENISPKFEQVMKKLNNGKPVMDLYLITISEHPDNMLEIIPQRELLQKCYPKYEQKVVGLAKGKKEALSVVKTIVSETYKTTGSADVRAYLLLRWEEQA